MIKLVIAEKPSVAKAIAKVIGASKQEDGYITGGGFAVSWCFGHLAELAQPESYNKSYAKWIHPYSPMPFNTASAKIKESSLIPYPDL